MFQTEGERNFHIFYQFCRGATAQERGIAFPLTITLFNMPTIEDYGVYEPENYAYLAKGNCLNIDGVDDTEEFSLTRNAMNVIGKKIRPHRGSKY